jgi:hypothetical protein
VATAATPSCSIRWGSLPKASPSSTEDPLFNVRAGRHACFDRVVFDVNGLYTPGYQVAYVPAVAQDGSGDVVPVRGGATLRVVIHAPAYTPDYDPLLPPAGSSVADVRNFSTLRDVVMAGSFEGQTTVGVGVRARLPFRVFVLPGPGEMNRVVLDVAHRW